jgi:dienelactone hydrolase
VAIDADDVTLVGDLAVAAGATAIVVFAHGSGSSRLSLRNQSVALTLQRAGLGTLLFDLLTREEDAREARTGELRFDIGLLTRRLVAATQWLQRLPEQSRKRIGYFGSSTGAAAALAAAAHAGLRIGAVVSRGGRPDLAANALARVHAPTLFIVGERDDLVRVLNDQAAARMTCPREIAIVPHATHLFEESGALDQVARLASGWFLRYLSPPAKA